MPHAFREGRDRGRKGNDRPQEEASLRFCRLRKLKRLSKATKENRGHDKLQQRCAISYIDHFALFAKR